MHDALGNETKRNPQHTVRYPNISSSTQTLSSQHPGFDGTDGRALVPCAGRVLLLVLWTLVVQWWMRDDLSWDGGIVVISVFGGLLGTSSLDQRTKRLELKEVGTRSSIQRLRRCGKEEARARG